jgi:hypothetical protein
MIPRFKIQKEFILKGLLLRGIGLIRKNHIVRY